MRKFTISTNAVKHVKFIQILIEKWFVQVKSKRYYWFVIEVEDFEILCKKHGVVDFDKDWTHILFLHILKM